MSKVDEKNSGTPGLIGFLRRLCWAFLWRCHHFLDYALLKVGIDIWRGKQTKPKILVLTAFRNEMKYLPGFFENITPQVDGIIALDDGSTDGSTAYAQSQPKVLEFLESERSDPHVWNEPRIKNKLIQAASKYRPQWLLSLDADERLEKDFRKRATREIHRAELFGYKVLNLRLYELWNSPFTARVDGIWGKKVRQRLFLWEPSRVFSDKAWHGQWTLNEADEINHIVNTNLIFYHLKMINAQDREQRMKLYKALDPNNAYQKIGYDYLVDERELKVKMISQSRIYLPEGSNQRER